jgi:hypothetical protein
MASVVPLWGMPQKWYPAWLDAVDVANRMRLLELMWQIQCWQEARCVNADGLIGAAAWAKRDAELVGFARAFVALAPSRLPTARFLRRALDDLDADRRRALVDAMLKPLALDDVSTSGERCRGCGCEVPSPWGASEPWCLACESDEP